MNKQDPEWWSTPEDWSPRMILNPATSNLYDKLCNMNNQTGKCEFLSTVILDEDISCVGTCIAKRAKWDYWPSFPSSCECSVDEPRTVRMDHSTTTGEFCRCSILSFLSWKFHLSTHTHLSP